MDQEWLCFNSPDFCSKKFLIRASVVKSFQAFVVFSMLSSAVYMVNDYMDRKEDQNHPFKKHRPLAAGLINPRLILSVAGIFFILSLSWGFLIRPVLFNILLFYLVLQILYNIKLRDLVILDLFCVSTGFFLRVAAGTMVIGVIMSRWLVICTILIALLLILSKRRHELLTLGTADSDKHRKVLSCYSALFLDQMIGVTAGAVILSYLLYCTSPETIQKYDTDKLIFTSPFVLYGVFRYLYLIYIKGEGGSPERIIVRDYSLLISVILWIIFCSLILNPVF